MSDPHWTTVLAALLTPTIAILGSIIAYRQWRIAQNKLKFDLFDRRFAVYDATRALLASIMTSGQAKQEEVYKFMAGTRTAKWLLNDDVAQYIDEVLWHKVVDLQTLQEELQGLPVGGERTRNVRAQSEIKKWLLDQFKVLDEKFAPFLSLSH